MADKCVKPMRCQTLMSGWMDGKHPEVSLKPIAIVSNILAKEKLYLTNLPFILSTGRRWNSK